MRLSQVKSNPLNQLMSKLYFYYGCMNCGKSLSLLSKAYGFRERGIDVLLIKSTIDTRDSGVIRSRALSVEEQCLPISQEENVFVKGDVFSIPDTREEAEKVLIKEDECQFLTEKQVDQLAKVVDVLNINVICYGLRTDFQTKLFPGSKRLFEIADKMEEMKSTCKCGNRASVNARMDDKGRIVTEGAQVECGFEDKYVTLCRKCFYKEIKKSRK